MDSESTETLNSINLHGFLSLSGHSNHNVYLSCGGEDTRRKFTDHLYVALTRAGIPTFKHDRQIPIGQNVYSAVQKAIRESRVSVVVFSKDYASSEWCLDELVMIVECKEKRGQLIVPVFYDVDSNDVGKQLGAFADAFAKYEECYADDTVKVEQWRLALTEASKLPGWDLQNFANGYEAKFIQEIVRHVLKKIKITKVHVAKHPVGLEFRVKRVLSLLKIGSDDVKMVGIYGMGGIGKSTIAKSVYNSAFHLFEGSCFIANVREVSEQSNGLACMQEQLLSQTLKGNKVKISNVHTGISSIQQKLCYKKVLIVLDDVDQLSQLEALAGHHHWFGLGSRIIITTRNEHLLTQAEVDAKFMVKKLNDNESLRLFSWHAFKKPVPLVNYKKLSNEFVRYSGGLPLALEVLGASLLGQTKKELWQSTLEKLRKISPNQIMKKLALSFETLDDTIKNIFLDIACFFIGMDKDYVIDIFNGCGFFPLVGISILNDRCLLKVCGRNKLRMHDLVRDMGRKIVDEKFPYEPGKRSRIWFQEDAINVLRRYKGSQAIEGLALDLLRPMHFSTKAFERMHRLRLLQINNVHLDGSFEGLFHELRWLCWHHCPLDYFPDDFHPKKLVSLDMQHNNFNKLWQGTKFLGNLKILNLSESESLTTTPDFTGVLNLEKLSLMACPKLSNVDKTIGFLSKLSSLNLGQCNNLKKLPNSICNLRSLQTLNLGLSSNLEQLPEKLGDLKQLRDIDLSATAVKEIPESIGFLSNLNSLTLSSCKNLRGLPSSICNVWSLEHLYVNGCYNLLNLPEGMGNIKCLRVLSASGTAVKQLPESIGLLGELTGLHLDKCKNLTSVPNSICNLISLENFNLGFCPRIELGESAQMWGKRLLNLTRLNLKDCHLSEEDIPHNLGAFSFLDDLDLGGNNFRSLPTSLGQLSNVLNLDLCGCKNLQSVQVFPPNLNWLVLKNCSSLKKLTLSTLKYLSSLDLTNCSSLVEILGLENLYSIKEIHLTGCSSLSTAFTSSLIQGHSGIVHNCAIYFSRMEIPNWFEYQDTGNSSISFDVPADFKHDQLEMTVWVDYSFGKLSCAVKRFRMLVTNITNDDRLSYSLWGSSFETGSWVRHIPPDYPLKGGDKVELSIEVKDWGVSEANGLKNNMNVEKYGVHIAKKKQTQHNENLGSTNKPFKTCKTIEKEIILID